MILQCDTLERTWRVSLRGLKICFERNSAELTGLRVSLAKHDLVSDEKSRVRYLD